MKTKLGFNPLTGNFDLITSELDADEVVNVPSGNLAATDVQGALNELQSDVDSRIPSAEKGAVNGVATLDGSGKIPSSQLPNTVMEFKGTWDAATNTPTLANGTGDAGDVYIVSVAGTVNFGAGPITFEVRDYVVYNGTTWEKSDASDAVTSVFGRQGVIVATSGDYTASQITNVPSGNLAAVEVQAALNELQSDVDGRQPLDSDLTALAGLSTTGLIARTGAGTVSTRAIAAGSTKISVTNGDGVAGNPSVDVSEANLTLNNIGGTLGGTKGGTGVSNAGSLTYGANALTLTTSGTTNVTLPTTGTLATLAGSEALTNKTLNDTTNAVLVGGNSRTATLTVGTNDNFALQLEANGTSKLRVNTPAASAVFGDFESLSATAGHVLPAGTQLQRPSSPSVGTIRLNTDSNEFEGYANGSWQSVGGGVNERPEKNYLKSFSIAAVAIGTVSNGTVSATGNRTTDTTSWASTNTANITIGQNSDTTLRGTANYLVSGSGNSPTGGTFVETPVFTLEGSDLGKPVSISFDLNGVGADGNFDVAVVRYDSSGTYQETIPVAGSASGATVPSAKLPTGTATFRGFFVAGATASDLYALRFRRLAGTTTPKLDTLYVGPQAQLAGAAVTDPVAYTPTFNGFGTVASSSIWRAQSGPFFIGYGNFTTGIVAASEASLLLPSGLTIDTSKLPSNERIVGRWTRNNGSATSVKSGPLIVDTANNDRIKFAYDDYTTANNPFVAKLGSGIAVSGDVIAVEFRVPIANWSSNVTMAERAVEEYAADDGSADVFGPNGVLVPNVGIGTTVVRDFVFQTSRQDTDGLVVEYKTTNAGWAPVENYLPGIFQGSKLYGVRGFWNNATTFRVVFGNGGALSNGTTYGANSSTSWQSLNIAGERWRVRKVSGGASVGYPIGARNVVGDTTGTAVPSGFIGERITSAVVETTTSGLTGVTLGTLALTAGSWIVYVFGAVTNAGGTITAVNWNIELTTDNTLSPSTIAYYNSFPNAVGGNGYTAFTNQIRGHSTAAIPVNVGSATNYYLRGQVEIGGGGTVAIKGYAYAVRIA